MPALWAFRNSILRCFVPSLFKSAGKKSGNRSRKPDVGEPPPKFRHLAKHSSLFLVTPAAKADDKRRGGTKLFCRWSNRHPSPSGWEGGRRPGEGAAVTGCCLASLPPCCEPGANHAANRAANQKNLLLWWRYWLVGAASEPLWLRVAGERRWPAFVGTLAAVPDCNSDTGASTLRPLTCNQRGTTASIVILETRQNVFTH